MSLNPEEALRIADIWSTTSEAHEIDKFSEILAEDFEMRYNFDPAPRTKAQLLNSLAEVYAHLEDHQHENAKITPTSEGFVIQATLSGNLAGSPISAPFCLVAQVRDGKVFRSWEYFDTAQLPKRVGPPGEGMR